MTDRRKRGPSSWPGLGPTARFLRCPNRGYHYRGQHFETARATRSAGCGVRPSGVYLLDGCCHSAGVPNAGELTQKLTRRCGFGAAISSNFSVLCIAENKGNTRAATLPDMRGTNALEAAPLPCITSSTVQRVHRSPTGLRRERSAAPHGCDDRVKKATPCRASCQD